MNSQAQEAQTEAARTVPLGYRQGIITAIAVFIGFSLAFLRYWGFEAPGDWTPESLASAAIIVISIVLQVLALFRSLDVRDDEVGRYRVTVRWLAAAVILLALGVMVSLVVFSVPPKS
jgi:hypothetical protein